MVDSVFLAARAVVLADLQARRRASADAVSALEDALAQRQWWTEQWPEGTTYVAGLVAQDVQDALFDENGRWPRCTSCEVAAEHTLTIEPALGADPHWVCEASADVVAPLGHLPPPR